MKVTVPAKTFANEVKWLARLLPTNPTIPVTAGLHLRATDDGCLHTTAYDYETGGQSTIEAEVGEPGQVLLPGRFLAEAVSHLRGDTLTLTLDGASVTAECGATNFKMVVMAVEDYPTPPAPGEPVGQVDSTHLAEAVARTAISASNDFAVPHLTGVHMKFTADEIILAATNSYRVSQSHLDWSPAATLDEEKAMLVNHKSLTHAVKTVTGPAELSIGYEGGVAATVSLSGGGRWVSMRLMDEAKFKPVDPVFARAADSTPVTVDTKEATSAVRAVFAATDGGAEAAVVLEVDSGQLAVRGASATGDAATDAVDAEVPPFDGPPLRVGVSVQYLLDALKTVDTTTTRIKLGSPATPILVLPEEGVDYRHMIAPRKIDSVPQPK